MMYKINLLPYNYTMKERNQKNEEVDVVKKCNVKECMRNVIMSPNQGHKGFRQYTVHLTAKKIFTCPGDHILLNTTDYAVLKQAFDTLGGWGAYDGELLARVYEAEQIEVNPN